MSIYQPQDFEDWIHQPPNRNRTYLEYLEEQLRIIDADLQPCLTAFLSKERIIYLEREREYFLAEIHKVKWAKIKHQEINKQVNITKEIKSCQE